MSDQPPRPASTRSVALTVLLIIVGIILLLPGLCSLATIAILWSVGPTGVFDDAGLILLWVFRLAVSIGGIVLIRYAWTRRGTAR